MIAARLGCADALLNTNARDSFSINLKCVCFDCLLMRYFTPRVCIQPYQPKRGQCPRQLLEKRAPVGIWEKLPLRWAERSRLSLIKTHKPSLLGLPFLDLTL